MTDDEQPKCALPDEHGGVLANPEQPNQNIMLVKSIQSLMTCVTNELEKLNEGTKFLSCHRNSLVLKASEQIDLFERTTLFNLQKAFE